MPLSIAVVDDLRRRVPEAIDRIAARMQSEVPAYAPIPIESLHRGIEVDVDILVDVIATGRALTDDELQESEAVGAERAHQGVPIDALLHGFRNGVAEGWAVIRDVLERDRLPARELLRVYELLLTTSDVLMRSEATGHERARLELISHDALRRQQLLHGLLTGSLSDADARMLLPAYALEPTARYHAIRARPDAGTRILDLEHALQDTLILAGAMDGDLIAIATRASAARVVRGAVGVGPPADFTQLDRSFAIATRLLETARAFEFKGIYTEEQLALRAVVVAPDPMIDRLVTQYATPLRAKPYGAVIEATLRSWFEHGLRKEETAKALFIHANTLRHRLIQYEKLTDTDLSRTEDLVAVWISLEASRTR